MEIWDLAKVFNMTVKDFCDLFGYTRQALYIGGGRRRERREEGMKRLEERSREMFAADIEEAERKLKARALAINELEKRIMKERYIQ